MKQILSGIQATGIPHLGNYLGALKPWVDDAGSQNNKCFYMIADLHAITVNYQPEELEKSRLTTIAVLLAIGLDPNKVTLFLQSENVNHPYCTWLLNSVTYTGELNRMIQFKEKSKGRESTTNAALYDYPVLQAADILLYDATHVPIGEDQKQHLELTKTVANRFNNQYGETLIIPEADIPKEGARVKNLQNPDNKMSKSDINGISGVIFLTDDDETIIKKVKRAVTDTGSEIKLSDDKPGISNLLTIVSVLEEKSIGELENQFADYRYGDFKNYVGELLVEKISIIREKIKTYLDDTAQLEQIINLGTKQAFEYSTEVLSKMRNSMGLKTYIK